MAIRARVDTQTVQLGKTARNPGNSRFPPFSRVAVSTPRRGRRATPLHRTAPRMCPEMFSKARSRGMGSLGEEGEGEGEGSHLMDDHEKPPSRRTGMPRAVPMAGLAVLVLVAWFSFGGSVCGPCLVSRHPTGSALIGVLSRSHV